MGYLATICDCNRNEIGTKYYVFCSGHNSAVLSWNLLNKSLMCWEHGNTLTYYGYGRRVAFPCYNLAIILSTNQDELGSYVVRVLGIFIGTQNLVFKLFDFSCQHYTKIPKYYILNRTANLVCKTNYTTIYLFRIREKDLHCSQC